MQPPLRGPGQRRTSRPASSSQAPTSSLRPESSETTRAVVLCGMSPPRMQRYPRVRADRRPPEHEAIDAAKQVFQLDEVHAGGHAPVNEILFGVRVVAQDPNGFAGTNAFGFVRQDKNRLWPPEPSHV